MRLAIIQKEKCKPTACNHECSHVCPINKKGDVCVEIEAKAWIDEELCVGCGICEKRCPFGAIRIVNLPSINDSNLVYRYGENGFALYGLPTPRSGAVVGLLGRNGIGKSTAVEILAGKKEINLGVVETGSTSGKVPTQPTLSEPVSKKSVASLDSDVKKLLQGSELQRYFESLKGKKISYKPQNLSSLSVDVAVTDLLKKRGSEKEIKSLAERLGVEHILKNKLNKLSGGELQKVAIIAASLGDADVYFFDEPLAFLDIAERLRVSDFIKEIAEGKSVVVVEHDLLILDYLTEYLNIFYGQQGAFGAVSGIKSSANGINSYLRGFLKEENMQIRDKALNFNFTKNKQVSGKSIAEWPEFDLGFGGVPESSDSQFGFSDNNFPPTSPEIAKTKLLSLTPRKIQQSGFSLKVKSGEIKENHVVGILGRNGTGKTSFVRSLVGELDVIVGGKKQKLDLKLDISYKPQYLFNQQDEVVRDIMIKEKMSKKLAARFNLASLERKKLNELSGGELQRFSIARALSKKADVYFFDEPSAYLDVEERISVAKVIKETMIEKEKTAFVVDHDLLLMSYLADSVIVFEGESGKTGEGSAVMNFEDGISGLLKSLDITLRKDKESGRPRINKKGSVLDREQKAKNKLVIF